MPIVGSMSTMIPNHVLRVGQSIRVDSAEETLNKRHGLIEPTSDPSDSDLDISLDNLNQLILELDPTFEPIQVNKSPSCTSPPTDDSNSDEDVSKCVLVPRGCAPCSSPSSVPSALSPSIPIPVYSGRSYSPHGSVVFSESPSSSRPPLPCGSVPRQNLSPRNDVTSHGSLRLSHPNRNSTTSLLSTSPGSDTSYIMGSCLSLASEDADSPESLLTRTPGPFSDGSRTQPFDTRQSPDKPWPTKPSPVGQFQELHCRGSQSSPASLAGSLTDIPVLLVNGAPEKHLGHKTLTPEMAFTQTIKMSGTKPSSPQSFQAHFSGSQPSMKFVMDTSKLWFCPHFNRAEAEALLKDKEPGSFVVRDSTSYRGSFGLAMKVDQTSSNFSPLSHPEEGSSELIRHFLIESSTKGVCIKGSSIEPYFGSLSALVYQHTITAYALPCKLLLPTKELCTEEKANDNTSSVDNNKTACNFVYLNAVPTEMLTGPCAVQKAVTATLNKDPSAISPTIVNMKASSKGVTLTDINRRLFFRRHYPANLMSYGGEDPEKRLWLKGSSFRARMFGFVAKGAEAGKGNVCHIFAEYDALQPCDKAIECIRAAGAKP
ncbi:tensin-4-like [Myripristis murdjan]|uniref:tensin-4-like n=1 Tax=Myripristis murdjan TaxID=586833 RepID=UPI0011763A38|nr:tensin-4 [Myripristis murdjan]